MQISKAVTLRLSELLKKNKISRYKFALKTGLSIDTLKSIAIGKTKGVNLKTLIVIAEGFDMTVSEFLNCDLFLYKNLEIE